MTIAFKPYYELNDVPNIIVDGRPHKDSALVLSHWKGSGTPAIHMRDSSAQIVLDYLSSYTLPPVSAVSNDHFDQDGLIGIFSIIEKDYALANKEFLIDVAEAGDFAKYKNRNAARVTFTIARMLDEDSGFFDPSVFRLSYPEMTAIFYQKLLSILPEIIERLDSYKKYWVDEDLFLSKSENLIDSRLIKICEIGHIPVAVVEISSDIDSQMFHWANQRRWGLVHDMAIHKRTDLAQILYRQGRRYWFKYRYESWVQFKSKQHPRRVDLSFLADELNAIDTNAGWKYDGSSSLTPILSSKNESSISFDDFCQMLFKHLISSPIDWDPFV